DLVGVSPDHRRVGIGAAGIDTDQHRTFASIHGRRRNSKALRPIDKISALWLGGRCSLASGHLTSALALVLGTRQTPLDAARDLDVFLLVFLPQFLALRRLKLPFGLEHNLSPDRPSKLLDARLWWDFILFTARRLRPGRFLLCRFHHCIPSV